MMNVPSLSAMMFKVSIKKQRKNLNTMIKNCRSEKHRKVLTEKLEALDLEELNFQDVQIESSKNLQKSELGEKNNTFTINKTPPLARFISWLTLMSVLSQYHHFYVRKAFHVIFSTYLSISSEISSIINIPSI